MTTKNKKVAGPRKSAMQRRSGSLGKLEFFELIKEQNEQLAGAYLTVKNLDANRVSKAIPQGFNFNFDEKVMSEMERTTQLRGTDATTPMLAIQEENDENDEIDFNVLPTPTKRESRPGLFVKRKSPFKDTNSFIYQKVITNLEMTSLGKDPTPTKVRK